MALAAAPADRLPDRGEAAAGLVVYLERRAAAIQQARTDQVMRQVCERTATALATRTRELFGRRRPRDPRSDRAPRDPRHPRHILTVHGAGYRLVRPADGDPLPA
jgi:hypothetical protein